MKTIHPTAIIAESAQLGNDITVGPGVIIGENCVVGDGCILDPRAILERNVRLDANVRIGVGTVLGGDPQDLKFKGEDTWVEIGEGTRIREYSTVNRGTSQSLKTTVGKNCFLMSYVHLAHDCHLGDGVIISNGTQLAGHVTIEDRAILSGLVAVHQFVKIGKHSFVGGCSRVAKDVPPLSISSASRSATVTKSSAAFSSISCSASAQKRGMMTRSAVSRSRAAMASWKEPIAEGDSFM